MKSESSLVARDEFARRLFAIIDQDREFLEAIGRL
jgi:hypothetical protein